MEEYLEFLRGKIRVAPETGFEVDPAQVNPALKPHQRDAVIWACRGGRRALFESFGLGKTVQELEWCRLTAAHEGGQALIVLPLGVRQEFSRDAVELLGMEAPPYVRTMAEAAEHRDAPILMTNYERVRDGDMDPAAFCAAGLDEASVLRSFGSKTYQTFLDKFQGVKYKLVCTATPSPNKYKELIHYAGYLEVMDTGQALTRFFQRDSTKANNLTLYPHKEDEFWLWLSTWALVITKPSDLGYDDEGYDLPPLEVRRHVVSDHYNDNKDRDGQYKIINDAAISLSEASREKRDSIVIRVAKAKEIVDADPQAHFLLWHALLNSLYRDNWVVQNVVGIIPDDMCREWFQLSGAVGPDHLRRLEQVQSDTALRESVNEGLRWGRLYGGAAGLIMLRGQEGLLDRPLDLDAIVPGSFQGLYILDRWCGIAPESGLVFRRGRMVPEYYTVSGGDGRITARVHHSRVVRFTGRDLPYLERMAELYWGASEVESLYQDVVKHNNVSANMAALTFRANVDTMEVQSLDQLFSLASGEMQRRFWNTMQAQSVMQSNFGVRVVNKGDAVHNTQYTFTGLEEVYEAMALDLSGASRIPMTKLFGRSPAGMDATGESDMRNYYDYVETLRESKLRPIIQQLLPVMAMSAWGGVPDGLRIDFPPLQTPSPSEVAEIAEKKAGTVLNVFQSGLILADTALRELKGLTGETGMFGSITDDEISAAAGKTYQDVTALRDPLAGFGFGGEEAGPFDRETGDGLTVDYKGQPREKNGRFSHGKLGKTSTAKKKSGKIKPAKARMGPKEFERVTSGFFTDHPMLKPGTERTYEYGVYQYRVKVKGPGNYEFSSKKRLK